MCRRRGPFPPLPFTPQGSDISEQIEEHRSELPMSEHMITMDPPQHSRTRSLLNRLLTPKRLKENEEFMWLLADQQIDEFIEEMLRMESPVKSAFPLAKKDTTLGRVDIAAGTILMVNPGAIKRDPRRFEDPHEFDIDRHNVRDIRLSEDPHGPADARRFDYEPTFILRGLTKIHIEFRKPATTVDR